MRAATVATPLPPPRARPDQLQHPDITREDERDESESNGAETGVGAPLLRPYPRARRESDSCAPVVSR